MWRPLAISLLCATPIAAQEFFTLKGHGGPIMDIAVSPSGQIATASFDNSVGLWQGNTPVWLEGHRAAVNSVTFADDSFAISGGDDFVVRGWDTTSGTEFEIGTHTAKVTDIAYSAPARMIATASWDSTIGLWRVVDHLGTTTNPAVSFQPKFLKGHQKGVNDVGFSLEGTRLYSASSDGTIRVWDVASGQEKGILVKHGFGVNEMVVNSAEGWLAYGAVDGGTRIIDLDTGEQIADFTLERRPILSMAYDRAGRSLAVGDGQGYIMVIDTAAQRISHDFQASLNGPIWALAFSPDGQNLHAGGIEDIVYSWPVATMTEHAPMAGSTRSFLEKPAALGNGERQFKRKCSICHALTQGSARKAGPSLFGLFGRKAGTLDDYSYSDTLDGSEIVWSAETIDALFDLGPDHYIPGTKMPMQRIAKQTDRDDLIDYLRTQTGRRED